MFSSIYEGNGRILFYIATGVYWNLDMTSFLVPIYMLSNDILPILLLFKRFRYRDEEKYDFNWTFFHHDILTGYRVTEWAQRR